MNFEGRGKYIWLGIFIIGFLCSSYEPFDRITWAVEVLPAILALLFLYFTKKRFECSNFLYIVALVHCLILFTGGHYSYAHTPHMEWLNFLFGDGTRNNFDKIGHFIQGVTPALFAREFLIRDKIVVRKSWTNFIAFCFAMTISAFYEIAEWLAAIIYKAKATSFLGTQGYVWDTQTDMFMALVGAILAMIVFGKKHNKWMAEKELEMDNRRKNIVNK